VVTKRPKVQGSEKIENISTGVQRGDGGGPKSSESEKGLLLRQ